MFALVDCNNFYASCERVFRPDLIGKPVVVLSNNDGCVIARSQEAKDLAIPMGAPAHKFAKLFEEKKVAVFSANFALYGDMSRRFNEVLEQFCPQSELYSIDETFLRFEGFEAWDLRAYGALIKERVLNWTGIPISVGIAKTKALAKIANRIAKKFPAQTGGVHLIDSEELKTKALKYTKIEDVWGIGRNLSAKLKSIGVNRAFDFTELPAGFVKKHFSVVGLRLYRDLQGIPTLDLESVADKKNIATTRSFEEIYTDFEPLRERVVTFAMVCAEKLRKQGSCCQAMSLFLRTDKYQPQAPQYAKSITLDLPFATHSGIELAEFAQIALKKIYKSGFGYKKAGVIVHELVPDKAVQTTLFESRNLRHIPLMQALDGLNQRYGDHKVKLALQDKRTWKMKQAHLSPRYTTRLAEVITVKSL
jgi:DNA polymerase V